MSSALIPLASNMPKGSEERRALLKIIKKTSTTKGWRVGQKPDTQERRSLTKGSPPFLHLREPILNDSSERVRSGGGPRS